MTKSRAIACLAYVTVILVFAILSTGPALAQQEGSFRLSIHAPVGSAGMSGKLVNITIQSKGSISMIMVFDNQVQVPYFGSRPLNATGTLNGTQTGSTLSGQIHNLVGKACVSTCFDLVFYGEGQWSGTLQGNHATGTIQGTITLTSSPREEVPIGQPLPFSGDWAADF